MTEKESIFSKQQRTFNHISLLNRVHELEGRLDKIELNMETLKTGQAIMCDTMVRHGILSPNGEPTKAESSVKVKPVEKKKSAEGKIGLEKLIGKLSSVEKTSSKSKLPYFLAEQKNNQNNNAFKVLQEKVRAHKGFWSKKQGGFLFKLWFVYGDESKLCWRKEGGK